MVTLEVILWLIKLPPIFSLNDHLKKNIELLTSFVLFRLFNYQQHNTFKQEMKSGLKGTDFELFSL